MVERMEYFSNCTKIKNMNTETAVAHNNRKVHYKGRTITVIPWVNDFIAQWRMTGTKSPLFSTVGDSRVKARMAAAMAITKEEKSKLAA